MQGYGADIAFIQVLVYFEQVGFMIHGSTKGLAQRRQFITIDDDHRTMHLGNPANFIHITLGLSDTCEKY